MSLRSTLNDLAASFANAVLDAIRGASLGELSAKPDLGAAPERRADGWPGAAGRATATTSKPRASRAGRLPRRSQDDIARALEQVVVLVKKHKDGLRAEEIRTNLGMQPKEMPRILKEGIAKKQLKTKGQKRATTYFAK